MFKRILLIDVDGDGLSAHAGSQLSSHWSHHPLGLMYVAAAGRRACPEAEFRILHTIGRFATPEAIRDAIGEFRPQLVGLRSLSNAQEHFCQVAALVRECAPEIQLIAGGPYASSSAAHLVGNGIVDLVAVGEGEDTFAEFLRRAEPGEPLPADLPGTVVGGAGGVTTNPPRPPIADLDSLPFPDYGLIDLADYQGISNHAFQDCSRSAFICSSRGCPYRCFYCHQFFGKRIRRRSARSVVAEMRQHAEARGIRDFVFVDDIFNVPARRAKEILSLIARELPGVRLNFPNGLRADKLDDEMIDLFEKAGCVQMALAVETACVRLQKICGKNLDLEKAGRAVQAASERFIVAAFFMVGFPTETIEEAMQTVEYAAGLHHIAQPVLSIVRVYENTHLYKMLEPNEEQSIALRRQEGQVLQPKLLVDPEFYGDAFPIEKVPLRGGNIRKIRWEWMRRVFMNPDRIRNSHAILGKFFTHEQVLKFYANLYDTPGFSDQALHALLRSAGR